MPWTDENEEANNNCIARLEDEERTLNEQLAKINGAKHAAVRIRTTKSQTQIQDEDGKTIDKIITRPSKDNFGEILTDEYKLNQLTKVISKTHELLGDE